MPFKSLLAEEIPADAPVEIRTSEIDVETPVRVVGSKTGHPEMLVLIRTDCLVVFGSCGAIRQFVIERKITLQINQWSVSQFLRNGYIPLPYTIFKDVYLLGFGDSLTVEHGSDLTSTVKLEHEFPFLARTSRGDSPTSVERFRKEMAASVERAAGSFSDRILMLSSGPDSGAVALGLADNGFDDVRCLTYSAGGGHNEATAAARLARRLGLKHETVMLPDDSASIADLVRAFIPRCFLPSADPTLIPYAMCLREAGVSQGICLDGHGELVYGRAQKSMELVKLHFNVNSWLGFVSVLIPHYSRFTWFFRPRINIYVRDYNLEPTTISKIYKAAVDTEAFWADTDRLLAGYDVIDYTVALRARHYEQGRNIHKVRVAASACGLTVGLPWRDPIFGEYMFNLPENYRYDRLRGINKPFCREVLRQSTGLENFVTQSFDFDLAGFCAQHRELIRAEVLGCRLWTREVEVVLRRLYAALRRHRFASVSIHDLFQLSAWLNHSPLKIRI